MVARYSELPSTSSAHLATPDVEAEGAPSHVSQDRTMRSDANDEGDLTEEGEERKGMLSGRKKDGETLEELEVKLGQVKADITTKSKRLFSSLPCSWRTMLLIVLSAASLVAAFIFFRPSSPIAGRISHWYSGAPLAPGTYSDDAGIAENPLPSGAKFGDIPFANLGRPWEEDGDIPDWAGGDGGALAHEQMEDKVDHKGRRWNGTHWFDKTVIMISLDGMRTDYLDRELTPHLTRIGEKGLRAEYMQSVFPSLTFPNHYSLITGLYPASHGIVANDFFDPATGKEFVYTEPTQSWDPEWWGGEPIWSTAVKNGLKSAVYMWPGPPVMKDGIRPTYWYPFHNKFPLPWKVKRLAAWLDMPREKRPQLITMYAPEVDQDGHIHGTHGGNMQRTLQEMDEFAAGIWDVLEERNLTKVVDVLFVSDHGMTQTSSERVVMLDDILGEEGFAGIDRNEGWPSAGLRFQPHINEKDMLERLQKAASEEGSGFDVYTAPTMPQQFHFSGNDRIAPIYCVPHIGWAISNREEFHVKMEGKYRPKGNHGYDPAHPDMHSFFIAHGEFADRVKASDARRRRLKRQEAGEQTSKEMEKITVIPGFHNLEIYNLVAQLLGIPEKGRAPNNGTEGFWQEYL